jgi:hypothetical protein
VAQHRSNGRWVATDSGFNNFAKFSGIQEGMVLEVMPIRALGSMRIPVTPLLGMSMVTRSLRSSLLGDRIFGHIKDNLGLFFGGGPQGKKRFFRSTCGHGYMPSLRQDTEVKASPIEVAPSIIMSLRLACFQIGSNALGHATPTARC